MLAIPKSGPIARTTMAYVLAGGRGSRLMELTDRRAKPAVYFGGKSRIIDFALSNALNSGIRRIGVATQYKAHSLIRHLQRGWNFFRVERNESFDILPASQRVSETEWYAGTADAVYQNIDIIESYGPDHIIILGRRPRLQDGLRADAAAAPRARGRRDGRLHRGAARGGDGLRRHGGGRQRSHRRRSWRSRRIRPACRTSRTWRSPAWASTCSPRSSCSTSFAATPPIPNSSRDFGKDIIPYLVKHGKAVAHRFAQVLRALRLRGGGLLARCRHARCLLAGEHRPDRRACPRSTSTTASGRSGPMARSRRRPSSCTTWMAGAARRSARWSPAAASSPARRCAIRCCSPACACTPSPASRTPSCCPMSTSAARARLRNVIVDRGVRIPAGLVVGEDPLADAQRFRRTEQGVCLITQPMLDRLGRWRRSTFWRSSRRSFR